jgi:hypothetical protein
MRAISGKYNLINKIKRIHDVNVRSFHESTGAAAGLIHVMDCRLAPDAISFTDGA